MVKHGSSRRPRVSGVVIGLLAVFALATVASILRSIWYPHVPYLEYFAVVLFSALFVAAPLGAINHGLHELTDIFKLRSSGIRVLGTSLSTRSEEHEHTTRDGDGHLSTSTSTYFSGCRSNELVVGCSWAGVSGGGAAWRLGWGWL